MGIDAPTIAQNPLPSGCKKEMFTQDATQARSIAEVILLLKIFFSFLSVTLIYLSCLTLTASSVNER